MMAECINDNRFEIIDKAKQDILNTTNISNSKDEMKALDSFLFRCWQMGWLDKYGELMTANEYMLRKTIEREYDMRPSTATTIVDIIDLVVGIARREYILGKLYAQKGENIPSADVVEVVRCKDCIHNEHNAEAPNALCELYYGMTDQYGFCSYGEVKDE